MELARLYERHVPCRIWPIAERPTSRNSVSLKVAFQADKKATAPRRCLRLAIGNGGGLWPGHRIR